MTDSRYIEAARARVRGAVCEPMTRLMPQLEQLFQRYHIRTVLTETATLSVAEFRRFCRELPCVKWPEEDTLDGWLTEMRLVKSADELAIIRRAQSVTDEAFTYVLSRIAPGRTEVEIALDLETYMRRHGAESVAFDTIAVSGVKTSMPHGVPSDKRIERGDFVTMDFGATVDGWRSDMTRTVAVGTVSDEQREVYEIVRRAHRAALDTVCAGVSCVQADAAARDVIAAAGYGDCFGHGTGHGVGIDIHEAPRLSPSAKGEVLRAGSVVTVEPGIYLEGRFGVRIENMVIVTETGCEDLTRASSALCVI